MSSKYVKGRSPKIRLSNGRWGNLWMFEIRSAMCVYGFTIKVPRGLWSLDWMSSLISGESRIGRKYRKVFNGHPCFASKQDYKGCNYRPALGLALLCIDASWMDKARGSLCMRLPSYANITATCTTIHRRYTTLFPFVQATHNITWWPSWSTSYLIQPEHSRAGY
jgi:hypothetical protein